MINLRKVFICGFFCYSVPVDIWTSTPLPPPLITEDEEEETAPMLPMSNNPGGCDINGEFFMDGMKVLYKVTSYKNYEYNDHNSIGFNEIVTKRFS